MMGILLQSETSELINSLLIFVVVAVVAVGYLHRNSKPDSMVLWN